MNSEKRGVLIGVVIGDGYLKASPGCKTVSLVINHTARQRDYLEHKASLIGNALNCSPPEVKAFDNSGYPGVRLHKSHRYFRVLRNWLYRDTRKQLSRVIRYLTPQGLALWYMDDGGLGTGYRRGRVHRIETFLNCHTSKEEAAKIADAVFDRFGIRFAPVANGGSYRLRCGTREGRRFAQIIAPFIVDGMRYKIDPLLIPTSAPALPTDMEARDIV